MDRGRKIHSQLADYGLGHEPEAVQNVGFSRRRRRLEAGSSKSGSHDLEGLGGLDAINGALAEIEREVKGELAGFYVLEEIPELSGTRYRGYRRCGSTRWKPEGGAGQ